ncbi:MAG: MBL fold metallo-hydrolase [Acidimicrobiales bacterium]|nr:MBL fold metallo-hydrolase [Acidimicrobiales bacterium]
MADLLALSAEMIDRRELTGPTNRVTNELSEIDESLAVVESFSHVVAFRTGDGLVLFDTSSGMTGGGVVESLRRWSADPVHTVVYTHGHVDHVGGSAALVADGRTRGHADPRVIGHENVGPRLARYQRTNGWNLAINARQFGGARGAAALDIGAAPRFVPPGTLAPTDTFSHRSSFQVGDLHVQLRHAMGETDDHAWAWIPDRRAVCVGDLLTWVFPNAGNPQKVQRYPGEWAAALREIVALEPELLLPAHGLPIGGAGRIASVLSSVAGALEGIVEQVVGMMNAGAVLDEIVAAVRVSDDVLALPWMQPIYDEPEFVVRNVWRQLGGWWDGNPARLKPPADAALAAEVAALAGGAAALVSRARDRAAAGDLRLAAQLVEWAVQAAPEDRAAHAARAEIYGERRRIEMSLMAKGVFGGAARESSERAGA